MHNMRTLEDINILLLPDLTGSVLAVASDMLKVPDWWIVSTRI